jgi:NADH:ubiquinone oxidoreductase subunit 3 (subunit A)
MFFFNQFIVSTPLILIVYGIITSIVFLVSLSALLSCLILNDGSASGGDYVDVFECGFSSTDVTSSDISDLRLIVSIFVLFDVEVWLLLCVLPSLSCLTFAVVIFIYTLFTTVELVVLQ